MATEPLPALPTQSSRRFGAGIINRWVADLRGAAPYLTAAVWLTLCLHGPLIVTAQFRYSFDAGVHEFFADHYRRSWFDLWEPRWYGGFSVASYPPLTHQLLALLSWPLGHEAAFGALLLAVLLAYPPAVYRFSRLFVGERASRYAAVATPLVPSLGLTAHSFGQLPTLVSSLGVLLLVPALADYLESGRRRSLGLAVALAGAATAAHHATFLFWLPLMCLAVTGRVLLLAGGPPVSPIHGTLSLRRRRGLAAMPSRSEPPPDSGGPHSVMLSRSEASPRLELPATGRCFAAAQHDGGWAPRGLCRLALAAAQPDGGWAPRGLCRLALAAAQPDGGWVPSGLRRLALAATQVGSGRIFRSLYRLAVAQQDGERVSRELRRLALSRAAVVGVLIGLAVFLVILPFWLWRLSAWVDQAPILHASRTNLLGDASAQNLFFWAEYGPLPAVFGFAVAGLLRRRTAALAALLALLVVLGLGGTTALPRWLYGPMWDWLTYDRFAFWGTLVALPFAGQAAAWWRCRRSAAGRAWVSAAIPALFLATFVVYSLGAATNGLVSPSEPKPVDLDPIAAFLHEEGRAAWRYLTFGLGDQAARLNYRTAAQTIDGSYHTARRLPALTASGIGQVDYALWWEPGGRTLDRILDEARARNVRWAFVNERPYAGYLARHGWIARGRLSNQVEVWELSGVEPVPPPPPRPVELPALLWGTLPLAAAAAAVALAGICRVHASCVSPSTRGGRACGHTRQHRSPALGGE